MTTHSDVVFLFDVDNTLLDNDSVTQDLRRHLIDAFGVDAEQRYWDIFEEYRREVGYADYLGALQRFRLENPREPRLLAVSLYLLHYPFASRLFPGAIDVIARLRERGPGRREPVEDGCEGERREAASRRVTVADDGFSNHEFPLPKARPAR